MLASKQQSVTKQAAIKPYTATGTG